MPKRGIPLLPEGSLLCSTVNITSSVSNYSKASRGLFVQVWVGRIFTAISISPSYDSRQLLCHSTFRAGRNLPDKEFRYHRTVIVTAAVHRSLRNQLPTCEGHQPLLTYRHWAGVSPYTLRFRFAETCVLVKQLHSIIYCDPDTIRVGHLQKVTPSFCCRVP